MHPGRVHVTGASGAGVTTLGRGVAQHYAIPHFDSDDVFWLPTAVPFTEKRPEAERVDLLDRLIGARETFVLSGSLMDWGDALIPRFDAVVFVRADTQDRLGRLRAREAQRFGAQAIAEDGPRFDVTLAFLRWAERYDDPSFQGRSLRRHRDWLDNLTCPVVEVDGGRPADALLAQVCRVLDGLRRTQTGHGDIE